MVPASRIGNGAFEFRALQGGFRQVRRRKIDAGKVRAVEHRLAEIAASRRQGDAGGGSCGIFGELWIVRQDQPVGNGKERPW